MFSRAARSRSGMSAVRPWRTWIRGGRIAIGTTAALALATAGVSRRRQRRQPSPIHAPRAKPCIPNSSIPSSSPSACPPRMHKCPEGSPGPVDPWRSRAGSRSPRGLRVPGRTPKRYIPWAKAQAPAYGADGKTLSLHNTVAPNHWVLPKLGPQAKVWFSSGWQRPANLPGDVGTIQVGNQAHPDSKYIRCPSCCISWSSNRGKGRGCVARRQHTRRGGGPSRRAAEPARSLDQVARGVHDRPSTIPAGSSGRSVPRRRATRIHGRARSRCRMQRTLLKSKIPTAAR